MDETRYPREGAGNWAWAVVTPKVVWYSLLPSRARYVATNLVGEKFSGILVSDRFAVYDFVDARQRQICWAHLLRDFARISQRKDLAGQVGRGLLGAGYLLFRWRAQEKSGAQFDPLCRRVKRLLEQGRSQTQCSRTANTCANLLKRKISGPTRSRRGDDFIARGFSAYESCLRQGRDLWNFMHEAVVAWIDKTTPPSLLPVATPAAAGAPSG